MPNRKPSRNRQCPYKGHCTNVCYGENPCDFALKFDKMQKKITRLGAENEALKKENAALKAKLDTILHPNF